jgi:hypothetical protein
MDSQQVSLFPIDNLLEKILSGISKVVLKVLYLLHRINLLISINVRESESLNMPLESKKTLNDSVVPFLIACSLVRE